VLANLTCLQRPREKRKYEEAAQRYQEALRIYERELSPDDPSLGQLLSHYAMLMRQFKRWKEAEALSLRAARISARMSTQARKRWERRWVGSLDTSDGCAPLGAGILIYGTLIGLPVAFGVLSQLWWLGWGSLLVILLGFTCVISGRISTRNSRFVTLFTVTLALGLLLYFALVLVAGFVGWIAGGNLLAAWQLVRLPVFIQWLLQGLCVLIFCAIATANLGLLFGVTQYLFPIPRYTIWSSSLFVWSLCGLPICLGLLLHSWWIFGGLFLGAWCLYFYLALRK
jgi:hypothetical protein